MTTTTVSPLVVVGAGPAGIMAAYTAAEAGVQVTLIDDSSRPGGQYYRQSPPDFKTDVPAAAYSGRPEAAALYAKLQHPNVHTIYDSVVWGVFEQRSIAMADSHRTYLLKADKVILATGAHDRPMAFPGWTLPGIYGAGATLRMVKTQWLLPGKRFLLAGLGPLQLALAALLVESGAEVVCVAEAANLMKNWRNLPAFVRQTDRVREALEYMVTLRRHRVPILYDHAIVAAEGTDRVEAATIAGIDPRGYPIPGTERHYSVDTVCLGYGLLPTFQLAAAFGCELRYDPELHWRLPVHNANMETSQAGVFVAGDVTDMGGAKVALAEGRVAGLAAAHGLGAIDTPTFERQMASAQASLRSIDEFSSVLQKVYAFRPGLAHLARPDTPVCRCEEVSYDAVRQAVSFGATDLHQVKVRTRAGMGHCQGRFCSSAVAHIIADEGGQPLDELLPFTVRLPIQPVPMGVLAAGVELEDGQ